MRPEFDEKAAQQLVGRCVLVGVTYTDDRDEPINQEQFHERVVRANAVYALVAVVRGTFYDSDDGAIDQSTQPVAFWLSVVSMTLLGLFILGVGHRWEVVRVIFELAGRPF